MKGIKVSIIVPVYNVENHLRRCLDSLLNQTLEDIEIILVNDCSTDQSETIILECQARDNRVVYLKQETNQGQGFARNYAIKEANGEYILFVDSDDYIDLETVETLYVKAKKLNLDILEGNYYKVYPTHKIEQKNEVFPEVVNGNEYFEIIPYTVGVIWNKLWRTDFIKENNLSFVKEIFEDVIFISQSTLVANRVFRIDYSFYYYIIRDDSTMTSKVTKKHIDGQMKLMSFLESDYNSNISLTGSDQRLKLLFYSFSSLAKFITRYKPENNSQVVVKQTAANFLKKKYPLYRSKIFGCKKLGIKQKMLFYISPYLMSFVLSKLKN